jgi:ADP-heptose:LPS heptosyltransferase
MRMEYKSIIISRTDSIGDVILTLPLAGYLKSIYPEKRILFMGRSYTKPIIDACVNIDGFINWSTLEESKDDDVIQELKKIEADVFIHVFPDKRIARIVKRAGIPVRIGTTHRLYHFTTCNYKVDFSRKNSEYHEAQLNFQLLKPLGLKYFPGKEMIPDYYGMKQIKELPKSFKQLLDTEKYNVILHPKSKGSAREWGLDNFSLLVDRLKSMPVKVFVSGTPDEGEIMQSFLKKHREDVTDLTGKMTLDELISFINHADALVAASTGPLHIAAALGKRAVGLYPPIKPMHPERWGPLGTKATYLKYKNECSYCKSNKKPCLCMERITPEHVLKCLEK